MFDVIAFDADDTLWHNETLYAAVQERFKQLLARYGDADWIEEKLYETEMRNLRWYGYGIKSFALSMIETAIRLSKGQIQAADIQTIIDWARHMLATPPQLFEHAADTIGRLSESFALMLITKGDLRDQEDKISRSGLRDRFTYIEIVSDKTSDMYRALATKHQIDPARFLMVGNSLRSDILPVLAIGGRAVYIPHHLTWAHENEVDQLPVRQGYFELEHLGQLPALVEALSRG